MMTNFNDNMDKQLIAGSSFGFSATRIDDLGSAEYSLVSIVVDQSSSIFGFEKELKGALNAIVEACKKSPRAENLMIRVVGFNNDIEEIHGFKLLRDFNGKEYDNLNIGGMTALYDGTFSGIAATGSYASQLLEQDFLVNGITFVITDGCENKSRNIRDAAKIAEAKRKAVTQVEMESFQAILIGVNVNEDYVRRELMAFEVEAEFDSYEEVDNATPETLANIAGFVSRSISSQSMALGTGGPSQVLALN